MSFLSRKFGHSGLISLLCLSMPDSYREMVEGATNLPSVTKRGTTCTILQEQRVQKGHRNIVRGQHLLELSIFSSFLPLGKYFNSPICRSLSVLGDKAFPELFLVRSLDKT